jgi:hypothetical protein
MRQHLVPIVLKRALHLVRKPSPKNLFPRDPRRYLAGDQLHAILPEPETVLSVECRGQSWSAIIFDLKAKQPIASNSNLASGLVAQQWLETALQEKLGRSLENVTWKESLVRRFDAREV